MRIKSCLIYSLHWSICKVRVTSYVLDLIMGLADVVQGLGDNPYFGAGFGLFGVGAIAAVSRKVQVDRMK